MPSSSKCKYHPSTMVIKSSNTFITYSAVLCPGWSRNLATRAFFLHKDNVVIWVGRYILRDILSSNGPRIRKASEHEEYSTNSNSNYAKISAHLDISSLEIDNANYPKLVIAVASYLCHPLT